VACGNFPPVLLLNKLLPVFVLPIGVITLLIALAALKKWRWLSWVAAGLLLVSSLPVVGNLFLRPLEQSYPSRSVGTAPQADAVLVLGGFMSPTKEVGLVQEWSEAAERFEAGVALARVGKAPKLLFPGDPRGSEGSAARREALLRGIEEARVEVIGAVGNTADEAEQLRRFAKQQGYRRVILVTSAFHMPRAMLQFRGAGVELVPFPVDYRGLKNRTLPYLDWIPSASALEKVELALREIYGLAFYRVFSG
jgi:uncharacterized SAM-binding protein YcdF (DUF218 family)